jgi:uncharacterized protein (TIGR02145 family)/uncharacterized repeat protein (TIGR02543 family)
MYTLTVDRNPLDGGSVSNTSTDTKFTAGTVVTVTATPESGYVLDNWTGTGVPTDATKSDNTITFRMPSGDVTLTANFVRVYSLTVNRNNADGGTASNDPNGTNFRAGTQITVTAEPADGYILKDWTGKPPSSTESDNSITFYMPSGDVTLTANFQLKTYTLTTGVTPISGGSVTPSTTTYPHGTSVTVIATANTGYTFIGWSGASDAKTPSINITMDGNKTVTANFQQNTYTLTTSVTPTTGGSVTPSTTTYPHGTQVTVTATAASGYLFTEWSGASTSTSASVTVTMDGAKTLTANFIRGFVDARDNKVYKTVTIGDQTWMAENLNYTTPSDSWCHGNNTDNCATYGRLYTWSSAMGLPSTCNSDTCSGQVQTKHQGACPTGWHMPTSTEWTTLVNLVGSSTAGTKLKATSPSWDGTDDYVFSALPGGYRDTDGYFYFLGSYGHWWTATEIGSSSAYNQYIYTGSAYVLEDNFNKSYGFSVRCLQD